MIDLRNPMLSPAMTLKQRLSEDMKNAMRNKDAARLSAIRLILAAIKQREIDERVELDDAAVVAVIDKMQKQRRDSIAQFAAAKRDDLVAAESFELEVLQTYMPAQASEDEIEAAIADAIRATGAAGARDMGKVMAEIKPKLAGRADMSQVSARIKAALV